MRCSIALMMAAALVTTACAEPADDTAYGSIPVDTAFDAGTPSYDTGGSPVGADAPSPAGTPDADDRADTVEAPTDDPDDSGGDIATVIPSRFHGEWNGDLTACGTGASDTRLRISAGQIRFYESTGAVSAVDIESERVVTVTATFQGEGDTWEDERRLSLSADGSSLTVSGGTELVRHRCP